MEAISCGVCVHFCAHTARNRLKDAHTRLSKSTLGHVRGTHSPSALILNRSLTHSITHSLSRVHRRYAKQGDLGSKLPPQPSGTVWKRGTVAYARWQQSANHGGGYDARSAPVYQSLFILLFVPLFVVIAVPASANHVGGTTPHLTDTPTSTCHTHTHWQVPV